MPNRAAIPDGKLRDRLFFGTFGGIMAFYVGLIVLLVIAVGTVATPDDIKQTLADPNIRASIRLSFISCTLAALLSVLVAIPTGYILSRFRFPGRELIDAILDIPIVLPPLVIGLCLLVLFNSLPDPDNNFESMIREHLGFGVTFRPLGVLLAQFAVAAAFAIRMMRSTFDQIDPRAESVARVLGCTRGQAVRRVVLPEARHGILAAGTMAWARALGEFGPILVFAGTTRGVTEVLSSTVFLEINIGNLGGAAAVSLLMILLALTAIFAVRLVGHDAQR